MRTIEHGAHMHRKIGLNKMTVEILEPCQVVLSYWNIEKTARVSSCIGVLRFGRLDLLELVAKDGFQAFIAPRQKHDIVNFDGRPSGMFGKLLEVDSSVIYRSRVSGKRSDQAVSLSTYSSEPRLVP
jgi:hypothetical protein